MTSSAASASSAAPSESGTFSMSAPSCSRSYVLPCCGGPGSTSRRTPSSPARSSVAIVRYGLHEESTPRYSKRPPDATRTVVVRFCQPQFL